MRCTQIMGLSEVAEQFLKDNHQPVTKECQTCHHIETVDAKISVYASAEDQGMFDDGPLLREYILKDGRAAREIVQAVPWSSGPCIFLCLEVDGKRIGEWDAESIDHA